MSDLTSRDTPAIEGVNCVHCRRSIRMASYSELTGTPRHPAADDITWRHVSTGNVMCGGGSTHATPGLHSDPVLSLRLTPTEKVAFAIARAQSGRGEAIMPNIAQVVAQTFTRLEREGHINVDTQGE